LRSEAGRSRRYLIWTGYEKGDGLETFSIRLTLDATPVLTLRTEILPPNYGAAGIGYDALHSCLLGKDGHSPTSMSRVPSVSRPRLASMAVCNIPP
jgi:hypothetical protein